MSKFQFSFDDSEDCKLYVGSDFHLNHAKEFMWGKRGFKSAQEHTDAIIDHVNSICRPQDICLHLGDFCLNTHPDKLDGLVSRIKCQMWWLKGNHNNPWEKRYQKECATLLSGSFDNFESISGYFAPEIIGLKLYPHITIWGNYLAFIWNKQPVIFNHFPYLVWDQQHHSSWSLCGHSHGSCPETQTRDTRMKQLDCGWELHNKLLSFEDIKSIMNKKQICQRDHHDKEVN